MSRDPIERGLEIEQAQLRGFARTVAEVEWLLLILVVLYLFIANPDLARSVPVLGVQRMRHRDRRPTPGQSVLFPGRARGMRATPR